MKIDKKSNIIMHKAAVGLLANWSARMHVESACVSSSPAIQAKEGTHERTQVATDYKIKRLEQSRSRTVTPRDPVGRIERQKESVCGSESKGRRSTPEEDHRRKNSQTQNSNISIR